MHDQKPLLFVPVETKVREYHGKLLLSLVAAERGFRVILGGQSDLTESVHLHKPGIYLDKSIASTKRKWTRWCKRLGLVNVVNDEEGLVYFDDDIYHELRVDPEVFENTPLVCTWGKAQQETILAGLPDAVPKLEITGNARFDLMRPEIRPFFRQAAEKISKRYGRIILINTNFGFYNHYHGVETEQNRLKRYPISDLRPEFFKGWIDAQKKMFHHFVDMMPRIRYAFPEHTIIIRPHPSESNGRWERETETITNCFVNSAGNVLEWISSSDILVHFNCTTAIEAYLMGVPAVAYRPESLGAFEQTLPNALSLEASNLNDLMVIIDEAARGEVKNFFFNEDPHRTQIANHYMAGLDGKLAAENMVDVLLQRDLPVMRETLKRKVVSLFRMVWLEARRIKDGSSTSDLYNIKKFPGLSQNEIASDIDRFRIVMGGRFSDIRVKPDKNRCYCIYKES